MISTPRKTAIVMNATHVMNALQEPKLKQVYFNWKANSMKPRNDFTEADNFLLELAMDIGFEVINDDIQMFQCSDEAIIELIDRVRQARTLREEPHI
jgi:hypothetical protein